MSERGFSQITGIAGSDAEEVSRSRSVLEEEREFFLRSLRDLEAERAAGDIDEVDYVALRDDYTVRAAHVLRQLAFLDGSGPDPDAANRPSPADPSSAGRTTASSGATAGGGVPPSRGSGAVQPASPPPRAWLKPVLTGTAVVLIVAGVAWVALALAGVRLPGEGVSGSNPTEQATQLVLKAETAETANDPAQAFKDYQAALVKDPGNAEALTGEGAILVEAGASSRDRGLIDEGISALGRAEVVAPSYGVAYAYRGFGYYYEGNFKAAVPQLEVYVADTPARSRISSVSSILAKAKTQLHAAS